MADISWPTDLMPVKASLHRVTAQAIQSSPFTGSPQVLTWAGTDRYVLTADYARVGRANVAAFRRLLTVLNGAANVGIFPLYPSLFGYGGDITTTGALSLQAAAAKGATSISVAGLTLNRVIGAGNIIQIGGLIEVVNANVTVSSTTAQTIALAAPLRIARAAATSVALAPPYGRFRWINPQEQPDHDAEYCALRMQFVEDPQ